MRRCMMLAAVGLTALFVSLPVSLSWSPSSSLPQLTTTRTEAWVTHRRARVATRRAYRRGYYGVHSGYYGQPDGASGYPYSAGHYAYRHVYAQPVHRWGWGGWHRPHWGAVRGWHWWR